MRGGIRHYHSRRHSTRALVIRGGLGRTFGSLACFLALLFLCLGTYILQDAFANPVSAQAAGLITAACSIALGAVLLFYLVKPRRSHKSIHLEEPTNVLPERAAIPAEAFPAPRKKARSDLAPRWVYVDTSRFTPTVRPRI